MATEPPEPEDPRLAEIIADYLEAMKSGKPVDREQLLTEHPDQADSLRTFFANHDQIQDVAAVSGDMDENTIPPSQDGSTAEDATLAPASSGGPAVGATLRYFGDYELLEEVARGGMGVVFKARQVTLNRIVALKMILSGQLAGQEEVQRFHAEAEAAANLDHPGIVPIYEVGEYDGQHYFSMGFIAGSSLSERLKDGPLTPHDAAILAMKTALAIAYAHARGVIHRDLKPANVLIDSDGQPRVTDFGLAKRVEGDSELTNTGQVLGTPSFMPPEQAAGKIDEIDERSDVYSLGGILYALGTGRPPFQAATAIDTLVQVLEQDPVPPRQLNAALDEDLQTICLKCLEKQPSRRYATAQALVEELNRYLSGEPIIARPIGRAERAWRWCQRKPAQAGLVAVAAALLLLLSIGGPMVALQQAEFAKRQVQLKTDAVDARDEADARRREADAARSTAEKRRVEAEKAQAAAVAARQEVEREKERVARLLYETRISFAHREWLDSSSKQAQQLLNECPVELRNWEWHYLDGLTRAEELSIFAHSASAQFFPDGETLITRGRLDNQIRFWDTRSGLEKNSQVVPRLREASVPWDNEHVLIVAGNTVNYVGIKDRSVEAYGDFGVGASAGLIYGDGNRVAAAFVDGTVVLYERPSAKEIHRTPVRLRSDAMHVFAPQADSLGGSKGSIAKVWDVQTGELHFEVTGHMNSVSTVAFSPDGTIFASVDRGGNLILTGVPSGRRMHRIRAHSGGVEEVEFSRDGQRVATGSSDRSCRIFDVTTGAELLAIRGHTQAVVDVAFHPDGHRIATTALDGTTRIWRMNEQLAIAPKVAEKFEKDKISHLGHSVGLESRIFYGHTAPVYDVAVSPDGRYVTTSAMGRDKEANPIRVWSLEDSSIHANFPAPGGLLHTMTYSADSRYLVVTSGGAGDAVSLGSVVIWDLETKQKFRTLEGVACMFARAVLNQQNDILAVAWGNLNYGKLRFYSFPEAEFLHEQDVTGERLSAIAFSKSSDELLSTSTPGGKVRIWNARTGEQAEGFDAHGTGVFQIAISADDKLATANIDGTIGIWDWRRKKRLAELRGHSVYAVDVAFSPDGTRLLSSSEDETVKVWDMHSYRPLLTFRDHRGPAMGAEWSADGRTIASTSRDGALIVRQLKAAESAAPQGEGVENWVTVFEDSFERDELGPDWIGTDPIGWSIRDGKLVGTLQQISSVGFSFPGAFLSLKKVDLPRSVEISADVTLRQPMLAQIVLTNRRTSQYIAPFIASTTLPYQFIGSSVQVARGEGKEANLLGGRSNARLEVGTSYRMRVIRDTEELKFFLDDRLLEHVRVPTIEADMLQLSGCFSELEDQIEFDNVVVRIPQHAVRQQEIRGQVKQWLTQSLIPDIVEQRIADRYTEASDIELANSFLKALSAGKNLQSEDVVKAFTAVAVRSDATPEEYETALQQARYYFERKQERWHLGKVGLALLRGGEVEEALKVFDRGIEEGMSRDGHVYALVYAGRALALHALGRGEEAQIDHQKLLDLMLTTWAESDRLPLLAEELQEKVPLPAQPLRDALLKKLVERDKAYWRERDMRVGYRDVAPDFVGILGRGAEPDPYDRRYDRLTFARLEAIFSASNPPPGLRLLWDQIQFDQQDDQASVDWVTISKFQGNVFRFGQRYEFERRDSEWLIVKLRSWQIDQRVSGQWQRFNDARWSELDRKIKESGDLDEVAAMLVQAQRFPEALEAARKVDAGNLALLGEAAITAGKFEEGIRSLEQARQANAAVRMPWFLSRVKHSFDDHKSLSFGVDFHPTKELMVTAHQDKAIVVWNPVTGKIVATLKNAHAQLVGDVVFSHDGSQIVSIGWDHALHVHDAKTGLLSQHLTGHLNILYRLDLHPHKDIVVTTSADGTAKIWDLTRQRELVSLTGHTGPVMGASFSPDGALVATASSDGSVRLWNSDGGRELAKIDAHKGGAWRVDWTPDGSRLISCGRDKQVRVWNPETRQQIAVLEGHQNHVEVVRVSPDGKLAASGDVDGLIWIWDLKELEPIAALRTQGAIYNLRFRGNSLFSVGANPVEWDIDFSRSWLQEALDSVPDEF